ncbi:DmX-like protein 2 [Galdieria sulphuraria]|nr:DmX-like protein 2 [Galdieria sulphuraria]
MKTTGEQDCWLEYCNHQIFMHIEEHPKESMDWLNPDSSLFCFCLFHRWDCLLFHLHSVIFSMANIFSTTIYKSDQSNRVQKLSKLFYWTRLLCYYFQPTLSNHFATTSVEYGYNGFSDITSAKAYFQEALSYLVKDENDDNLLNLQWKMKWKHWLSCYWLLWKRELPLDSMALKFLMISKAWYEKAPECSILPLSIVLLACVSDCDKLLFEILFQSEEWTSCCDNTTRGDKQSFDSLWYFYRYYGVGYWVSRREDLTQIVDTCARASFQHQQNPMDTCLWYVLLGRTKSLAMLFKVKGMKRLWEFFSGDFDNSEMQIKAKKNAYVTLARHQIELSSALFILAVASRLLFDWEDNNQRCQILELLNSNDVLEKEEMILLEIWIAFQSRTLDLWKIERHEYNTILQTPLLLHSTAKVSDFLQNMARIDLSPSSWMTFWMLQQIGYVYFQKSNTRKLQSKQPLTYPCLLKEYGKQWFSCDPIFSLGCFYSVTEMTEISLETLLDDEERLELLWYHFVSCLAELTSEELKEYKSVCYDLWKKLPLRFHQPSLFPFVWICNEIRQWKNIEKTPKVLRLLSFLWCEREWIGLEACLDNEWKRDWWCKWLSSWNGILRKLVKLCIEDLASGRFLPNSSSFVAISNTMESLKPMNYFSFDFNLWKATQAVYNYYRWMMDILSVMEEQIFHVEALLKLLFNCPSLRFPSEAKQSKVEAGVMIGDLRRVVSSHTLRPNSDGSQSVWTSEEASWMPSFSSFKACMENDVKRQAILYLLKQTISIYIFTQWRLLLIHNKNQNDENELVDVEFKAQSIVEGFYKDWAQKRYPLTTYNHSSSIRRDSLYQLWSFLYQRDASCRRLLEEGWLVLEGIRQGSLEKATISNRVYGLLKQENWDRESYPHILSQYNSFCLWKGDKDEAVRSLCLSSDDPCWIAVATLGGLMDISVPYSKLQQISSKPSLHRSSSVSTFPGGNDRDDTKIETSERIWKYAGQVACVTADPVRQKYASGHMEGTIKLWNFGQSSCLGQWKVPNVGRVSSLAFSSFGERLVACHATGQLVIWDEPFLAVGRSTVASPLIIEAFGKRRASQAIFLDDRNLIGVVGSPQGPIASGSSLRIYDIRSPHYDIRPEWTCKVNHGKESRCILILEDRTKVVTGGMDGSISIVDIRMRHCVAELASVHRGEIQTLGIETNRGRAIFSGCSCGEGKLWDSRTMKCLDTIRIVQRKSSLSLTEWNPWRTSSLAHRGILTSCLTDTCLLVGCADGSLRLWGKGWSQLSKGQS